MRREIKNDQRVINELVISTTPADVIPVAEGRCRVVVEGITPVLDGGRYALKRVAGEELVVEADVFTDGHDAVTCALLFRHEDEDAWAELPMTALGNDRWQGRFIPSMLGRYFYSVRGWVDRFRSWARDLTKRIEAGQDVTTDLLIGAAYVDEAAEAAKQAFPDDARQLVTYASALRLGGTIPAQLALAPELARLMERHLPHRHATTFQPDLPLTVDLPRARFSAWYELFPRSTATAPGKHGTLRDVIERLPYIASMGFDVLYLPPIHPIGRSFRKGKNNNVVAQPNEPGSPWAIGATEGGHKAILPELGTLEDFHHLIERAKSYGIDIAMDIAFQCAPDHPYVTEHPAWFRHRPDGTIQYAENPPKKYQDIYPFDFESSDWQGLWAELKSVFTYWIEQGVHIFRVDNPHTKAFPFWEWAIAAIKRAYPEVMFLSEAFTRPKVMHRLAKIGFTQSYTYFAWRTAKWELTQYLTELTQGEVSDYFRPNFWPNTPDILTEQLQSGERSTYMARLALAATLAANYGIYGPTFELMDHTPLTPGKEEYLNSEKYEVRYWNLDQPYSLREFIARINKIRRDNPALHSNQRIQFQHIANDHLIAYTKSTPDLENVILTVVNLDSHYRQAGWIELPLEALGIDPHQPYQVHDLISDVRYTWNGPYNYVELDPMICPVHIFRIRRRMRSEQDFEYYS